MKTKPIVPWIEDKRRLVSQMIKKNAKYQYYVDLFSGGAALFFMREQQLKMVVSDNFNGQLVNLYRVVQHH